MDGEIRVTELARLQPAALRRTEGCDYVFKRRADHYLGQQWPRACRFDWEGQKVYTDNEISLAKSSLWLVLYACEKPPDGSLKNGSDVLTDPEAARQRDGRRSNCVRAAIAVSGKSENTPSTPSRKNCRYSATGSPS